MSDIQHTGKIFPSVMRKFEKNFARFSTISPHEDGIIMRYQIFVSLDMNVSIIGDTGHINHIADFDFLPPVISMALDGAIPARFLDIIAKKLLKKKS